MAAPSAAALAPDAKLTRIAAPALNHQLSSCFIGCCRCRHTCLAIPQQHKTSSRLLGVGVAVAVAVAVHACSRVAVAALAQLVQDHVVTLKVSSLQYSSTAVQRTAAPGQRQ